MNRNEMPVYAVRPDEGAVVARKAALVVVTALVAAALAAAAAWSQGVWR